MEKYYLFIFNDDHMTGVPYSKPFKEAIWELAKYCGCNDELLNKCLKGFDETDISGLVGLFNYFSTSIIDKVYVIDKVLYNRG